MPGSFLELVFTYVVLGLAGEACLDPVYRIFNHAVGLTAQLYRRTVSNFMNRLEIRWLFVLSGREVVERSSCI